MTPNKVTKEEQRTMNPKLKDKSLPGQQNKKSLCYDKKQEVLSSKGTTQENLSPVMAEDKEAWEAYLETEKQWEEVYRRLAN